MSRRRLPPWERHERWQIEYLCGLEYGDLSDEKFGSFAYNYAGVPQWAQDDFDDLWEEGVEYRTVIGQFLFGSPPEVIVHDGAVWRLRRDYLCSPEVECPREGVVAGRRCGLCDARQGEPHGMIYLGEGWLEVVYRHDANDDDEVQE